jgi:two-component system sensor histidine kinase PilS (NtrC family)
MSAGTSKRSVSDREQVSQSTGLLLICRLVLAGAVLAAGRTFFRQDPASTTLLFVAAAILVATVLYSRVMRKSHPATPMLHVQIGADLIVVSWVVAITGRTESPFVLLYFISIMLAGSFLLVRGGLVAAAFASAGLLAVCAGPALWEIDSLETVGVLRSGVDVAFFFLVGALSGYLGRNTQTQHLRLLRARSELHRVKLDTDCIVRNMGSGLLTVDSTGTVTHLNPAGAAILQAGANAMDGARLVALEEMGMAPLARVVRATLEEGRGIPRKEIELPLQDGRIIPLGISTSVVRDEQGAGRGVVAVFQDLTEAREMEQKSRRNETLAAVGELGAAVAHEIRNCLSPISGSVEVLAKELKVEGENKQLLDLILRESRRLESFIGVLLDYARVRPLDLGEVDLEEVLTDVLDAAKRHRSFKHRLSLHIADDAPIPSLCGDRGQLHQAFLNLAINALEAMPEGGALAVRLAYTPAAPGRSGAATVEFTDTGGGVKPEHLKRVFEPFFTTKRKGSGLGLAVVRQVIERHGGSVAVASEHGSGACVRVTLPCRAAELLRAA